MIVALGKEAAEGICGKEVCEAGGWLSHNGLPLLVTRGIEGILGDAEEKKAFWTDLKQVMHRLGI